MAGISRRQGGHHDVQKLTSTTLPRKSESATVLPSNRSRAKLGAVKPSLATASCCALGRSGETREKTVQNIPRIKAQVIHVIKREFFIMVFQTVIAVFPAAYGQWEIP